jgi:hypothetical protein
MISPALRFSPTLVRWLARSVSLLSVLCLVQRPAVAAETDAPAPLRKGVILVQNRAGADHDTTAGLIEDMLGGKAAGHGIQLLSRQAVTDALDKGKIGTDLDTALGQQSSALRLAQNLDVDFILLASLASIGVEDRSFKDESLDVRQKLYTMRVSYKLLEAGEGGALAGDTVKATAVQRAVPGTKVESTELYNRLAEECVDQLMKKIPAKVKDLPKDVAKAAKHSVTIVCGATDLTGQAITLPDLGFNEDGTVKQGNNNVELLLSDVTVEVNGVVMGSAPGTFELPKGLNKIRLTREGFSTWERTINVVPNQKLKVSLAMSEAGYARWKDNIAFLNAVEKDRKLTDADVKVALGFAKMLEQSGYRVDIQGKSLYDGATIQQQHNMRN